MFEVVLSIAALFSMFACFYVVYLIIRNLQLKNKSLEDSNKNDQT